MRKLKIEKVSGIDEITPELIDMGEEEIKQLFMERLRLLRMLTP